MRQSGQQISSGLGHLWWLRVGKPDTTFAKPPACDRHQSLLFKAYGSAVGLMDLPVFTQDAVTTEREQMYRHVAGPGLVCVSVSTRGSLGLCVSTSGEDNPSSPESETHNPNRGATPPGALPCRMARGWGWGRIGAARLGLCVSTSREDFGPLLRWKHTTPTGHRGVRAHLAMLGSDCTPFFSLFYGGTGVGTVHRSHCHIISYHIIS